MRFSPFYALTATDAAQLGVATLGSVGTLRHRWLRICHRRLGSLPLLLKWTLAISLVAIVGFADVATVSEMSFSIFYLLPIAFATWFIRARAGLFIAIMAAVSWYAVEVAQGANLRAPWIPLWNAGTRLIFFVSGVGAVALVQRTATRLLREVVLRTRSLRVEAAHRRRLEREMIETSAREQLRLAQDLHDGVGQYLSALTFHSRMLADDLQQHHSPFAGQAERMVALIRKTNQVTRQLHRTLQVPEAREGLNAALRGLATEFEDLTGIRCEFDSDQEPAVLDEFRTMMLFRIVQEAFNNSVKHARPQLIRASLRAMDEGFVVTVLNDGYGASINAQSEAGSGSLVMRLRAELIGARLTAGPDGPGTYKVECVLPVSGARSSPSPR